MLPTIRKERPHYITTQHMKLKHPTMSKDLPIEVATNTNCPLCGYLMIEMCLKGDAYEDKTYAWSCPECPFVAMEYYNETDLNNLRVYLGS